MPSFSTAQAIAVKERYQRVFRGPIGYLETYVQVMYECNRKMPESKAFKRKYKAYSKALSLRKLNATSIPNI